MSDYKIAEIYTGLRSKLLGARPTSPPAGRSADDLWAVLMETGYATAVVTLLAFADGTVSLYLSNGGGLIGMGGHEGPRKAARALLDFAPTFLDQLRATSEFPLPLEKHTRFYLITYGGSYTAEALEEDLGNQRHSLSPLFYAAHGVITEIRLVSEKLKTKDSEKEADKKKPQ
jgi:hypothetical protein